MLPNNPDIQFLLDTFEGVKHHTNRPADRKALSELFQSSIHALNGAYCALLPETDEKDGITFGWPVKQNSVLSIDGTTVNTNMLFSETDVINALNAWPWRCSNLNSIRAKYKDLCGDDLYWNINVPHDKYDGCAILAVCEGMLYIPYITENHDYATVDRSNVCILNETKLKQLISIVTDSATAQLQILLEIDAMELAKKDDTPTEHDTSNDSDTTRAAYFDMLRTLEQQVILPRIQTDANGTSINKDGDLDMNVKIVKTLLDIYGGTVFLGGFYCSQGLFCFECDKTNPTSDNNLRNILQTFRYTLCIPADDLTLELMTREYYKRFEDPDADTTWASPKQLLAEKARSIQAIIDRVHALGGCLLAPLNTEN